MPSLVLPFPAIDPVAFELGPLVIRWYALAYVAGLVFAWWYARRLVTTLRLWDGPAPASAEDIDDLLLWATLGVILGGRLGYVLFYSPHYFAAHPVEILRLWHGGMSFHGGFLGVVIATALFCRRRRLDPWRLIDLAAAGVPVGLGLGRLANFINGELYGRPGDVPWAMVFPGGGPEPRHPSQLYEAFLEGLVLFLAIRFFTHRLRMLNRRGFVSGVFAVGYGLVRFGAEFFRMPDAHIGVLAGFLTRGMLLSLPMILWGLWLLWRAREHPI